MSHAEAFEPLHPALGATEAVVSFVSELRFGALSDEVRHYARRHLLDTVGVMIAGAGGELRRARSVLAAVARRAHSGAGPRRAGRSHRRDVPRRHRRPGIERRRVRQGSVHPGCVVVPAVLALGYERPYQRSKADRGLSQATKPRSPSAVPSICASADSIGCGRGRIRRRHGCRQAAGLPHQQLANARDRGFERCRTVRLRQRRRRHQRLTRTCLARGLQAALLAEQASRPAGVIEP